ncbi:MAG TPA: hypothetical protein EYP56_19390 [Planctomycetaceae bacterium]|nr:hypothetical protein [Planctomycetaceae bacterium]
MPNGANGPTGGFDFTGQMRWLCDDIARRHPAMRHIDMSRVAIRFSWIRKANSRYRLLGNLTPLRFSGGRQWTVRNGRRWRVEPIYDITGREMLYLLTFYLPRFFDRTFREKLTLIFHELWHISPDFDGDVRRFAGRCYVHGPSRKSFNREAARMANQWLALRPPLPLYLFLYCNFQQLVDQYGTVYGTRIPNPKLVPEDEPLRPRLTIPPTTLWPTGALAAAGHSSEPHAGQPGESKGATG